MSEGPAISAAADFLSENAEELVAEWIEWVQQRVPTTTVKALPARALRNHIPPVLGSLARYIRNPIEIVREELLSHLRLHGQVRRDQGYSLKEVLAEFDGLASIVTEQVNAAVLEQAADADGAEVLEMATRLAAGLRSVSYIAMGTYSDSDGYRRHSIATGLEEFARAIGHELRNPLNTLGLGIQVLRTNGLDAAKVEEHVSAMEAAIRRTGNLLDTIHSLAVAEGARTGDQLVPLASAVAKIKEELIVLTNRYKVEEELRVEDGLPEVKVEAILAYIVLVNVVGNAIKYSDSDKEERWVQIEAAVVEEEHDSGFIEITVTDNGLGIPPELVTRVRQRGFRAHPEHAQGTGLGLYLVHRSITDRGGELVVESEDGEGTTVRATIRCLQSEASALTAERFRVEHLMGAALWESMDSADPDED